jgi:hypothetical protein
MQVVDGVLRAGDVIAAAHSGDKFTVQVRERCNAALCPHYAR